MFASQMFVNETGSVFFKLSYLAALKEHFQAVIDLANSNQSESLNSLYDSDLRSQLSYFTEHSR